MVILIHFSCLCHYISKWVLKKTKWQVVILNKRTLYGITGENFSCYYNDATKTTSLRVFVVHISKLIQLISLRANSITCKLLHLTSNFHVHEDTPLYRFTNNRKFYLLWQPLLKEMIILTTQINRSSPN